DRGWGSRGGRGGRPGRGAARPSCSPSGSVAVPMTEAPQSAPVPAGQAFDAALVRGQAAMAEPLPVLAKVDPERSAARTVGRLRETLAARFGWHAPAATVAR